jgi:hypothetical protein
VGRGLLGDGVLRRIHADETTARGVAVSQCEQGGVMTSSSHPFHTHDLIVLVGGAALVAIGVIAQGGAGADAVYTTFERDGLSVPYPQSAKWFAPATAAPGVAAGVVSGVTAGGVPAVIGSAQCSSDPKALCAGQPTAQITVRVYDDELGLGPAQFGRDHAAEYGARAKRIIAAEAPRELGGKPWLCARFAYVPVGARSESVAIECSLASNKKLYAVTLSGPEAYVATLEPNVIGKLVVK